MNKSRFCFRCAWTSYAFAVFTGLVGTNLVGVVNVMVTGTFFMGAAIYWKDAK